MKRLENKIEEFMLKNMTHISGEEYMKRKGEDIGNYDQVHLEATGKPVNPENLYSEARRNLARKGIEKGCRYLVDMDFGSFSVGNEDHLLIVATGLKSKEKR